MLVKILCNFFLKKENYFQNSFWEKWLKLKKIHQLFSQSIVLNSEKLDSFVHLNINWFAYFDAFFELEMSWKNFESFVTCKISTCLTRIRRVPNSNFWNVIYMFQLIFVYRKEKLVHHVCVSIKFYKIEY